MIRKRSKKAFTLVELVVVIAVLLVLSAIAIPIVGGIINNAQTATDDSNAKGIETAIKYALAHMEIGDKTYANVGEALADQGMNPDSILAAKQAGFGFYYDTAGGQVTAKEIGTQSPTEVLLEPTTPLTAPTNTGGTGGPGGPTVIPATAITLDQTAVNLNPSGTAQLTPTLEPATTTNTAADVTWASDNNAIATVSSTGLVTAVANGSTTIRATINSIEATCDVTVSNIAVGLVFSPTGSTMDRNDVKNATVSVTGNHGAPHDSLSVTSSNNTLLAVSGVTANAFTLTAGSATSNTDVTITVRAMRGTTEIASTSFDITVNRAPVNPTQITFSPTSMTLDSGGNASLTATPNNDYDSVSWSVTSAAISLSATTGNTITVTAGTVAIATDVDITVRAMRDGAAVYSTTYAVRVNPLPVNIAFSLPASLFVADNQTKTVTITPTPAGTFSNNGTRYTVSGQTYTVSFGDGSDADTTISYNTGDTTGTLTLNVRGDNQGSSTLTVTFSRTGDTVTHTCPITVSLTLSANKSSISVDEDDDMYGFPRTDTIMFTASGNGVFVKEGNNYYYDIGGTRYAVTWSIPQRGTGGGAYYPAEVSNVAISNNTITLTVRGLSNGSSGSSTLTSSITLTLAFGTSDTITLTITVYVTD